ncbi:hypothetical protein PUMCH_003015 [Australozyma saopauloensis]|uniref:AB hydrolase-1 domain-containing protein n=1 Tax=Australozyma saopauloensis TaxID=291208 RepID=A0AAX4HAX9_9ASCO|nr:hypothetical protein PUMCH_003015 [[Candida] saopauloensis]
MFTTERKIADAAWPRGPGSSLESSDRFKLAYVKYTSTEKPAENAIKVNLIFSHGTGMNKSVWKVHINKLFELSKAVLWHLNRVLAIDCVNHGDSALLNKDKIAWAFDWRDGGKDIVKVVQHEASTTGDFVPEPSTLNILVGHSFGGFGSTYASYLEPSLFSGCIALEPVLYSEMQYKEFFFHRLQKVQAAIKDTFDLMEDAVKYFQKASFYRTLEPEVLKDFVSDELYPENGKVKAKASLLAQMATYCSAFYCLYYDQDALKTMKIPYYHIVGSEAAWNLPQTVDFVQESVPADLLEQGEIAGTHLMFGENVADTVKAIHEFCDKRAQFAQTHLKEFPSVKCSGDRSQMLEEMCPAILEGDYSKAFWYGRPEPKI